jgi:crossover junction endodeoxyribonuclease RuvC
MPSVLAIDPGLSGAMVALVGHELSVSDLPITREKNKTRLDIVGLADAVKFYVGLGHSGPMHALIEKVGSMPMQGLGSAFNFGFTTGAIHGVLAANGFTIHAVTPAQWKFGVGLNAVPGQDLKARKAASRAKASELFPEYAHLFARVKDDGRAEAALMAWWFIHKRSAT